MDVIFWFRDNSLKDCQQGSIVMNSWDKWQLRCAFQIQIMCKLKWCKIIIIIITSPDEEILGWCPAGDSLISWGERSSLTLMGNPSSVEEP